MSINGHRSSDNYKREKGKEVWLLNQILMDQIQEIGSHGYLHVNYALDYLMV